MSLSMIPLLIHNESLSEPTRAALRAVVSAPASERRPLRRAAARLIAEETELECDEALDLVGLERDLGGC